MWCTALMNDCFFSEKILFAFGPYPPAAAAFARSR
jgi:hypothetical protein